MIASRLALQQDRAARLEREVAQLKRDNASLQRENRSLQRLALPAAKQTDKAAHRSQTALVSSGLVTMVVERHAATAIQAAARGLAARSAFRRRLHAARRRSQRPAGGSRRGASAVGSFPTAASGSFRVPNGVTFSSAPSAQHSTAPQHSYVSSRTLSRRGSAAGVGATGRRGSGSGACRGVCDDVGAATNHGSAAAVRRREREPETAVDPVSVQALRRDHLARLDQQRRVESDAAARMQAHVRGNASRGIAERLRLTRGPLRGA